MSVLGGLQEEKEYLKTGKSRSKIMRDKPRSREANASLINSKFTINSNNHRSN